MAQTYSHLYKLPCTGLRFFTVYGPWGRPDMAQMIFAKSIIENKPIKIFNFETRETSLILMILFKLFSLVVKNLQIQIFNSNIQKKILN